MYASEKTKQVKDRTLFITTAIFLLASVVCFIINYSVNRTINWSLFPVGALIVIWATITPLLIMKKNKMLGLYAGLSLTLIPFLFLIQKLAGVKGWVMPLALPIAGLFLIALGVSLVAFAYFKSNKFYPAAFTVFLFGVIVNFGVGVIVSNFLNNNNANDISRTSTMTGSIILSILLVIAGYIKGNRVKPGRT
jgi:membrane protein YdbS with pleckstrin-like domain